MKTHNYWLKLFTVFIFTFLFSHVYAVQIELDGTIIKTNGDGNISTCHAGDEFILKNTTTYDGVPFDLKLKVTAEENEADVLTEGVAVGEEGFIARPCIGINDGMIEFILRDMPDENGLNDANDAASMDIEISTVRQDDQEPLAVNSLQFTALDLDKNYKASTDDIYLSSPSRAFKDANESKVTIYDNGNFGNGFDIRVEGYTESCDDNVTNPEPECRVSGFIEINSLTDVLRIRIQNDDAFGTLLTTSEQYNSAYRLTQISFNDIDIVGLGIDHGDMPASYGDAYHDINISTILGQSVADRETFVPSDNADSDDADINSSVYDDEGAVSIVGQDVNATFTVSQGRSYDFNVTTTGTGYLSAWIDYNSNGIFDAGEQVITDELIEDATLSTKYTYHTVTIPNTAQSGKSYIRFRFSQNQGVLASGNGGNGEVEDYVINIGGAGSLSGHVYDDKNGNGVQDGAESNLANVTVRVTDAGGTTLTATTDASGNYIFSAVSTGDANVTIDETTLPTGVAQTEGTNPTTVTIVGSTANIEENNGFQRQVDLKTEKTVDNASPKEGDTIVYTLKVTNNGPSDASNITLTDRLPAGVTYVSDTGGGDYTPATGIWTISSLTHGTDAILNITATVNSGTTGQTITNIATAATTPDANDTTPDGDDLNETITVGGKPTVSISDVTVIEGQDLVFDVNLSEASNFPTVINITTEDTTATAGKDYEPLTTTVIIDANKTSAQVTVKSIDDNVYEPTAETFDLKGEVTSSNTQNTDPSGKGTITDNDSKPTVTITGPNGGDARVVEGTPLVFDINLSNPTTEDIVIDLSTLNGTALSSEDYNATTGTVTIEAETTGTTFTVVTIDDLIDEVNYEENLTLNGTVSSGEVSNPTVVGTGIILDNDVNATDDNATGEKGEPVTIDVLANDGNDLNASSVRLVDANGNPVTTLNIPGEGTWDVNSTTGEIVFTPEAGYTGDPTPVKYTVKDNAGNTSPEATITVNYPQGIEALDDKKSTHIGDTVVVDVLANDIAENTLDPTSVKIVDGNNSVKELVVPNEGTWTVDNNGSITFVPVDGFIGDPTPIEYTVADNEGTVSDPATVTIDYNQLVDAKDDKAEGVKVGDSVKINVLENDESNLTLDPASVKIVGAAGDGKTLVVPNEGNWTVDANGSITFTPNADFTGDPTPIEYTVADEAGNVSEPAKVEVDYAQEVEAISDSATGEPGEAVTIDILNNDSSDIPLNPASVKIIDPATKTPVTELVVPGEGKWIVSQDGKITFVPENGFVGDPEPISYIVEDTAGNLSNEATVTVTYAVKPPEAGDDNTTTEVGDSAVINLLGNDKDSDNDMNASTVDLVVPSGATGEDTDNDGDIDKIVVPNEGTWTVDDAGVVTFIPDPGFTADPTPIEYTIGDSLGNTSDVATIAVNVLQQLHDDSEGANAGDTVTMNILENDDTVVPNTVSLIGPDGSVDKDTNNDGFTDRIEVDGEGVWTVDDKGVVTFVPEDGFEGDPTPITYTAQDNSGNTLKPATLTIVYSTHTENNTTVENNNTVYVDRPYGVPYPVEVSGGTTPPVEADEPLVAGLGEVMAIDDNATFCEGTSLAFNAAANDVYADGTFNLINPETGAPMAEGERLTLEYGSVTMNKDGVFTYTPFPETLTIDAPMEEHFTYRLINVKGEYDTAKVNICIACCPESSDSVDALSSVGLAALLLMFGTLGLYFVRKEEEANI